MFILSDSSLTAKPQKYKYSVLLADIREIRIHEGSYIWKATAMTAAVGGGLGLLFGLIFYVSIKNDEAVDTGNLELIFPMFALAGGVAGGLIGMIVGAASPYFESYPLKEKDLSKKHQMLKKIFKHHNIGKRK